MGCLTRTLRFAALLLAAATAAAAPPPLIYGYPEQPPRAFTNAQGQPDGSYLHLLRQLLPRAGLSWRAAGYPAKRLMVSLDSGETNFSILVRNPLLDACCLYGSRPVWFDELRAYRIGDKPPIRTRADLAGKRVITLAGFAYGGLIAFLDDPANGITVYPAPSHKAAFEMLGAGRADYLLDYAEPAAAEGFGRHPLAGLASDLVDTVNMYFVIRRDYPEAAATLRQLETLYRTLRDEDPKREYTR